jgi:hypothetical protein
MDDGYESMSRDELLVRVRDWRQLANDRSTEIARLQAIVDALLTGRYAGHRRTCATVVARPCDCGLNALLESPEATNE